MSELRRRSLDGTLASLVKEAAVMKFPIHYHMDCYRSTKEDFDSGPHIHLVADSGDVIVRVYEGKIDRWDGTRIVSPPDRIDRWLGRTFKTKVESAAADLTRKYQAEKAKRFAAWRVLD